MVENPPSSGGDTGLISGWGTNIPHAMGQLSPWTTITEPECPRAHATQQEKAVCCSRESPCVPAELAHTHTHTHTHRFTGLATLIPHWKTLIFIRSEAGKHL